MICFPGLPKTGTYNQLWCNSPGQTMAGWRWEIRQQTAIGLSNLRGKSPKKTPGVSLRFVWSGLRNHRSFTMLNMTYVGLGQIFLRRTGFLLVMFSINTYKPTILIYWLCPHQHYWNLWLRSAPLSDDGWIHSWRCVKHNVQAQYHVKPNIMCI